MSYLLRSNVAAPSAPASGKTIEYIDSITLRPALINSSGVITPVSSGWAATVAASAAINTTETIVAGLTQSVRMPANYLQVGSTFRVTLNGTNTSTVANNSTFRARFGTAGTTADTSLWTAVVASAASGTTVPFQVVVTFTVRTIGASGTIAGTAVVLNQGTTGISTLTLNAIPLTVSAINTTATSYLTISYQSAAATTTSTFQNGIIEQLL